MKELYRAVVQRRPILAMLEPDASQDGGLGQHEIESLITNALLDEHRLRSKWEEWRQKGEILPEAIQWNRVAPGEQEVRAALFATPPVEWHRLPHLQDVTIRLIAQRGVLRGEGELYLQGGTTAKPSFGGRIQNVFCSPFNAGAAAVIDELTASGTVTVDYEELFCISDISQLDTCEGMLVLLDKRTWTSGENTFRLGEHIEAAVRLGLPICCAHEFPSLVGSPRHALEFGLVFDATPPHLSGRDGPVNLYREIAVALLGDEWRKPGLVALAAKLVAPAPRRPQACESKMAAWWAAERSRSVVAAPSVALMTASAPSATFEDLLRALAQLPPEAQRLAMRQVEETLQRLHLS